MEDEVDDVELFFGDQGDLKDKLCSGAHFGVSEGLKGDDAFDSISLRYGESLSLDIS